MKYLLPCSCGNSVPVETGQAGQTVTCVCGTQLEVPAMRAIRQLEPVRATAASRSQRAANWSLSQRLLFSLGLAIAATGFATAGYYQRSRSNLATDEIDWDATLEADLQRIDALNLVETWENWKRHRDTGIGPYNPPNYVRQRKLFDTWWRYILVASGAGIGGLVLVGIAFLLPGQSATSRRKGAPNKRVRR